MTTILKCATYKKGILNFGIFGPQAKEPMEHMFDAQIKEYSEIIKNLMKSYIEQVRKAEANTELHIEPTTDTNTESHIEPNTDSNTEPQIEPTTDTNTETNTDDANNAPAPDKYSEIIAEIEDWSNLAVERLTEEKKAFMRHYGSYTTFAEHWNGEATKWQIEKCEEVRLTFWRNVAELDLSIINAMRTQEIPISSGYSLPPQTDDDDAKSQVSTTSAREHTSTVQCHRVRKTIKNNRFDTDDLDEFLEKLNLRKLETEAACVKPFQGPEEQLVLYLVFVPNQGSRIKMKASVTPINGAREPGRFDYEVTLYAKHKPHSVHGESERRVHF